MTTLGRTPTGPLPTLREAAGLAIGTVYVAAGQPVGPELVDKQNAVLETAQGGMLELRTCASISVAVTAPGTYLHAADFATVIGQTNPTLRRYVWSDTAKKLWSAPGLLTALTALLGVITAIVGTFFVWSAMSAPAATTINDRAESLIEWVATSSTATGATTNAATAASCLKEIRGETTTEVTVPGISCTAVHTPWWRQPDDGSLITGATGVLTALLAAATLRSKFGFRKSPAT